MLSRYNHVAALRIAYELRKQYNKRPHRKKYGIRLVHRKYSLLLQYLYRKISYG